MPPATVLGLTKGFKMKPTGSDSDPFKPGFAGRTELVNVAVEVSAVAIFMHLFALVLWPALCARGDFQPRGLIDGTVYLGLRICVMLRL